MTETTTRPGPPADGLHPAERMVLTVARAMIGRGENPPLAVTAVLLTAVDRLAGNPDAAVETPKCRTCNNTGQVWTVELDGEGAYDSACPDCDTPYPDSAAGPHHGEAPF